MLPVPQAGEYKYVLRDFKGNGRDKKRRRKQISYYEEGCSLSRTGTNSSSSDTHELRFTHFAVVTIHNDHRSTEP